MVALVERGEDGQDLAARNRRTAGWLVAWIVLLAAASVAVIWGRG